MADKRHLQHVRSKVVESNGQPKLPSAGGISYGELAINYHKGTETISLKNDENEIVLFHDEVEIGSGEPKVNTEIWIDLSDSGTTEIYTKQQIDSQMSGITNDITSIKAKDVEQDARLTALENVSGITTAKVETLSGAVDSLSESFNELSGFVINNIVIGTVTPGSDTELFVDTGESAEYEVYTKAQVNAIVAYLQAQIDELKNN